MNFTETKKLPFWETVGRSFKYVFKNKFLLRAILPIIGLLALIQMLLGMPVLCSVNTQTCGTIIVFGNFSFGWKIVLTSLTLIIASIGIIINYCRSIICKAEVDYLSSKFWKQVGLYMLAAIVLSIVLLAPAFLGIMIFVPLFNSLGLGNMAVALAVLIPIVCAVSFAPLFLVFPAIAAEDYAIISWRKLFQLTKDNHNAIFWGQFFIMIPYWLVSQMVGQLYLALNIHDNYFINLIFVLITLCIGILDACFKGAFFAHIYQFFKFYDNK